MNRLFYAGISLVLIFVLIDFSHQHGYLIDPPARSSAWLVDRDFYNCCINYQHNQMFCGGVKKLWYENGGRCGICGESWDEPKLFERGGSNYLGKILKRYITGSIITVEVYVTANHKGFFEFRLCDVDGWETDATQECLNSTVLRLADNPGETKYKILPNYSRVSYRLKLPENFTCDHCVMQWKWVTGNSWGHDDVLNISCVGCGVIQEQFFGCTDVSIKDRQPVQVEHTTTTTDLSHTERTESSSESTTVVWTEPSSTITTTVVKTSHSDWTSTISSEINENFTVVTTEPETTTSIEPETTKIISHSTVNISVSPTTSPVTEATTETTITIPATTRTISTTSTTSSVSTTTPIVTTTTITSTTSTTTTTTTTATTTIVTSTTTSTTPTTSSTTSTTNRPSTTASTQSNSRNDCESKLEFGALSDVSDEIKVFCNEMCANKCKQLIAEFKENLFKNTGTRRPNTDLMACLETCPVLCSCTNHY